MSLAITYFQGRLHSRIRTVTLLRTIMASSGIGISLISASVVFGYVFELLHNGGMQSLQRTEMAPHTAICFLLTGVALVAMALHRSFWRDDSPPAHHE